MRFLSSILLISTLIASAFAQTADTQAKLISAPKFVLSSAAEQAGIDGALSVALRIDKTGAPKNVRILGGPSWPCSADPKKELEAVREAVKENVQQARFSPVLKKGEPVESDLVMTFLVGNSYRSAMKESEAEEAVKKGETPPKMIQGGVLNGKVLKFPRPEYPSSARMQRAGGAVPVQVMVDEQGNVVSAGAVSGHSALQSAAREAACSAKFAPVVLSGQAVKVTGVITYHFQP